MRMNELRWSNATMVAAWDWSQALMPPPGMAPPQTTSYGLRYDAQRARLRVFRRHDGMPTAHDEPLQLWWCAGEQLIEKATAGTFEIAAVLVNCREAEEGQLS